jgi:hypothetical protein
MILSKFYRFFAMAILAMIGGLQLQSEKMKRQLERNDESLVAPATLSRLALTKARRNQHYIRACLTVKADNEQLAQWVAYHYAVLPLRRLIVGVDVNATEDPMHVMGRWNNTDLQFEVWYPADYAQNLSYSGNSQRQFLLRQHRLMARCMQHFHNEGDLGWVALTDTDEYIKLNPLDDFLVSKFHNETSYDLDKDTIGAALPHMAPNETIWDRIEFRKRLRLRLGLGQHAATGNWSVGISEQQRLESLPTVFEVLEQYSSEHGTLPCHSFSRRRYSVEVDNFTSLAESICHPKLDSRIMNAINISKLSTIQFLYHVPPLTFKHNEWAKVLVDLRRIPYGKLSRVEYYVNPHMPLDECPRAFMPDIVSIIQANHYTILWSNHVARRGAHIKESLEQEKEMWSSFAHARDHIRCDQIHGWLNDFVSEFGLDKAKLLLGI